jgi:hypothetical protein
MPYTTSNLPDHVKALGATEQRQWMHVANGCIADGKDEGTCLRMANGVVKRSKGIELEADERELVDGAKEYQYVSSYEYAERQVDQSTAGYDPLGAGNGKGCANCQWFIAPNRCTVVAGTISPTGLSSLWRAVSPVVSAPIPVTIVNADGSATKEIDADPETVKPAGGLVDRVLSAVKSAFGGTTIDELREALPVTPPVPTPLFLVSQKDGRTRFFTAWSNNFMDREKEIFPESAHKEFVEWADRNKQYPQLWQWHTPGTKYGQVDWLDYTDGFIFASGLIDAGSEWIAEKCAKEDTGVSHGFKGLQTDNTIVMYRSYEISTLPRSNAAVWTTSFNLATEGAKEMPFTDVKKSYLKEHGLSDEQIVAAEAQAVNLSKAMKDAGVQWKDTDLVEDPPVVAGAASTGAAEPAAPVASVRDTSFETRVTDSLDKLTAAMVAITGAVKAVDDRVKSIEGVGDAAVARALQPNAAAVVQASRDTTNVVGQRQASSDAEWFGAQFGNLTNMVGIG